ncbi:uncharacterized protein LOC141507246 [Macrotis lagotis]|uniref:uncharacterized protein LOC141507246 n=1 Tax=Macrotis lagotis TaxID=92651 RepID=UPI003D695488
MQMEKLESLLDTIKVLDGDLKTDKNSWHERKLKFIQMETKMGKFRERLESITSRIKTVEQRILDSEKLIAKGISNFTNISYQNTKNEPREDQNDLRLSKENKGSSEYRRELGEDMMADSENSVKEQDQNWPDTALQDNKNGPEEDQKDLRFPKENKGSSEYRKKSGEQTIVDSESNVKNHDRSWPGAVHQDTKNETGEDQKDLRLPKENKGRSEYRKQSGEQTMADNESNVKDHDQSWWDAVYQDIKNGLGEDQIYLRLLKENKGSSKCRKKSQEQTMSDNESIVEDHNQSWPDSAQQDTKNELGENKKDLILPKDNKGKSEYSKKSGEQTIADRESNVKDHDQGYPGAVYQDIKNDLAEDQIDLKLPKENEGKYDYRKKSGEQTMADSESNVKEYDQNWPDAVYPDIKNGSREDQIDLRLPKESKGIYEYRKESGEETMADSESNFKDHDQSWPDAVHQDTKNGPGKDHTDFKLPKGNKGRSECRKKSGDQTRLDSESKVKDYDQSWPDSVHQDTKNGSGEDQIDLRLPKENKGRSEYRKKSEEQTKSDSESNVNEHNQSWCDSVHQDTKNGPGEDEKDLMLSKENKGRSEYRKKSGEQIMADSETRVKKHDQNWPDAVQQDTKNGSGEDQKDLRSPKGNKGKSGYRKKSRKQAMADSESNVKELNQSWRDAGHQNTKNGPGKDQKDLRLPKGNKGKFEYRKKPGDQTKADSENNVKEQDQNWPDAAQQYTKNGPGEDQKELKLPKENKGRFDYRQKLAEKRRLDLKKKQSNNKAMENFVLQGKRIV